MNFSQKHKQLGSLNKFQYFLQKAKEHETCMYIAQRKNVKHLFVINCSRDQRN
jgi:hypothetical protein